MLKTFDIKALIVQLLKSDLYIRTMEEMNRNRLSTKGTDINELKLRTNKATGGEVYAARTIELKIEKGQRVDIVTAKDTGKLHESIISKVNESFIEIRANRESLGLFFENVDTDEDLLLGLTQEDQSYLIEMLKRDLPDLILNNITEEHLFDTDLMKYV